MRVGRKVVCRDLEERREGNCDQMNENQSNLEGPFEKGIQNSERTNGFKLYSFSV